MVVNVACPRDCYDTCRLKVYVENGKITKIAADDDRYTQGILCPRAAKDVERVYSSLRVLYSSVSINGGVFKRIDWDDAIDFLVSREVIDRVFSKY